MILISSNALIEKEFKEVNQVDELAAFFFTSDTDGMATLKRKLEDSSKAFMEQEEEGGGQGGEEDDDFFEIIIPGQEDIDIVSSLKKPRLVDV